MHDPKSKSSAQGALSSLADDLSELVRDHFALFKAELAASASEAGEHVILLIIWGLLTLTGYLFLNLALIVVAGWLGGQLAMVFAVSSLAVGQIGGGIILAMREIRELKSTNYFTHSKEELERSQEWLTEMRDRRALPAKEQTTETEEADEGAETVLQNK